MQSLSCPHRPNSGRMHGGHAPDGDTPIAKGRTQPYITGKEAIQPTGQPTVTTGHADHHHQAATSTSHADRACARSSNIIDKRRGVRGRGAWMLHPTTAALCMRKLWCMAAWGTAPEWRCHATIKEMLVYTVQWAGAVIMVSIYVYALNARYKNTCKPMTKMTLRKQ